MRSNNRNRSRKSAEISSPLVTVVIPTFNRSAVLRLAIESVLAQTMSKFELLVIGDCCTDNSEEVVGSFLDPRITWINLEKNVGIQTGPNNEGLRRSQGTYVAYLGHDDLWFPDHLKVMCRALSSGASFAYAQQVRIDAGRPPYIWPPQGEPVARRFRPPITRARDQWAPGTWMPPTAVAHRTDLARSCGGWRLPSETDAMEPETDLWARLAHAGGQPVEVCTLTSVKFSAATRKNVYQTRPSGEQERWWAAIAAERSGARVFARAQTDPALFTPICDEADLPPAELWDVTTSFESRHRLRRQFRGLPPDPTSPED